MKFALQDEIDSYGSFNHEKILIVDDNDTNIFVVKTILEDRKLDVDTALNGTEGLARFESSGEFEYKVIFLDINMYDLDGYEVAKRIRQLKRADAKQIPIYALSANIFASDRIKAKEAGMSGYITKPINYKTLFTLIREILEEAPKTVVSKLSDKKKADEKSYLKVLEENVLDNLGQHFIFNALNTIKGAVLMNSDQTCSLINDLSDYMQYRFNILRESREVNLNEELRHLKAYSRLEMARFSYIDIIIEEQNIIYNDYYIPAMSLIFLVENSVHHGLPALKNDKEKKAAVVVKIEIQNNIAKICIEDNGVGFEIDMVELSTKFGGVKYIENQINELCNGKIEIVSCKDRGTKVTILLESWRNTDESNCSR